MVQYFGSEINALEWLWYCVDRQYLRVNWFLLERYDGYVRGMRVVERSTKEVVPLSQKQKDQFSMMTSLYAEMLVSS